MIPFWCACCTAWQTCTNSSSRCADGQVVARSQYSVIGIALHAAPSRSTAGRVSVAPASKTLAMLGWSIIASACRSASKRAMTCARVHPELDDLQRHHAADRLLLLGHVDRRPCRPRRSAPGACSGPICCGSGWTRCCEADSNVAEAGSAQARSSSSSRRSSGSPEQVESRNGPRCGPGSSTASARRFIRCSWSSRAMGGDLVLQRDMPDRST